MRRLLGGLVCLGLLALANGGGLLDCLLDRMFPRTALPKRQRRC